MEAVPREKGRVTVDVVQCYLHSRKCGDGRKSTTERKNQRKIQRRANVSFVDRRVDLDVGPRRIG